jgi:hypothetical protein
VFAVIFTLESSEIGYADFLLTVVDAQSSLFYVPFAWFGLMLSNFFGAASSTLLGTVYMFLSIIFIGALYALAVLLNKRFGLYEPPTIKTKSNIYTPKKGILTKLGFSPLEAAIIYKDLKTWTRRSELNIALIFPIFFIELALFMSFDAMSDSAVVSPVSWLILTISLIFLWPASMMAYMTGLGSIGQEGEAMWRIYASPISAKNFVRSKYFLSVFFGLIMLAITGVSGLIIYRPTLTVLSIAVLEAVFLIFALGAVSLNFGFRGADFAEFPKVRLFRPVWAIFGLVVCIFASFAILVPVAVLTGVSSAVSSDFGVIFYSSPSVNPFIATAVSGIIAAVITLLFYKLTLNDAKKFLRKADGYESFW